jgi:hypothetical protein
MFATSLLHAQSAIAYSQDPRASLLIDITTEIQRWMR